jgi:hypothetical protein
MDNTNGEFRSLVYRVLLRFVRGFIAGALGQMILLGVFSGNSWAEVKTWLVALGIACLTGGITGGMLALDKAIRG